MVLDVVWQNKTSLCFSLLCWDFNKIFCCLFNLFYHGESYFENCYSLLTQQTYCFIRNRCKHVLPWPFILKDSTPMFNFTCLALFLFRPSFSCNKWKCKNHEYSITELLDLTFTAIRHTTVNVVSRKFQNVRAEITMHCFFSSWSGLWWVSDTQSAQKMRKVCTVYTRTAKIFSRPYTSHSFPNLTLTLICPALLLIVHILYTHVSLQCTLYTTNDVF